MNINPEDLCYSVEVKWSGRPGAGWERSTTPDLTHSQAQTAYLNATAPDLRAIGLQARIVGTARFVVMESELHPDFR